MNPYSYKILSWKIIKTDTKNKNKVYIGIYIKYIEHMKTLSSSLRGNLKIQRIWYL